MKTKGLVIGLVLLPVVVAACVRPSEEGTSVAAVEYLEEVDAIFARIDTVGDSIDEYLNTVWPTKGELLDVLREAGISATFEGMLEDAGQLTPPERYRADHEQLVRQLRDQVLYTRHLEGAIDDQDLVGVVLATTNMFLANGRMLAEVSATFCEVAADPEMIYVCGGDEPLPGGEYGVELQTILKGFGAEFGPRVGFFPRALAPEELFASLRALQPEIINALEEAQDAIRELEPPRQFRTDHDRLLQYFEETLDVARAISLAVEERDTQRLLQVEFPRSGAVVCSAQKDFSPEFRPIVAVFFGDEPPPFCG